MHIKSKFFVLIFLLNLFLLNNAYADHPALTMVKQVSENMIQDLKTHETQIKTNPRYVYQLAYKHIVPHANIDEMSKRVLPPDVWRSLSTQQKSLFERQFTLLLVKTYASALNAYRNQSVQFSPVRASDTQNHILQIDSDILEPGAQSIHVSYKFMQTGQSWKLIDLMVEGVSLISSFRSQFSAVLNKGDITSLINDMARHNAS